MYTEGTVMVYAVPGEKKRVTARTVYTEVRVNRGEGVFGSRDILKNSKCLES